MKTMFIGPGGSGINFLSHLYLKDLGIENNSEFLSRNEYKTYYHDDVHSSHANDNKSLDLNYYNNVYAISSKKIDHKYISLLSYLKNEFRNIDEYFSMSYCKQFEFYQTLSKEFLNINDFKRTLELSKEHNVGFGQISMDYMCKYKNNISEDTFKSFCIGRIDEREWRIKEHFDRLNNIKSYYNIKDSVNIHYVDYYDVFIKNEHDYKFIDDYDIKIYHQRNLDLIFDFEDKFNIDLSDYLKDII